MVDCKAAETAMGHVHDKLIAVGYNNNSRRRRGGAVLGGGMMMRWLLQQQQQQQQLYLTINYMVGGDLSVGGIGNNTKDTTR